MAAFVDRRLKRQIEAAGEDGLVEALIVVSGGEGAPPGRDDGGLARQVIADICQRAGEAPVSARYFPRANAAVLTASGRFMRHLLGEARLFAASACDIDAAFFDW